ncbi:Terminal uridylyltransferase 7 [Chamberlinius hualienensis]
MATSMTNHEIEAELRKVLKISNDPPADVFTENANNSPSQSAFNIVGNILPNTNCNPDLLNSQLPSTQGVGVYNVADIELANHASVDKVKEKAVKSKRQIKKNKLLDDIKKPVSELKKDEKSKISHNQGNNFDSILSDKAVLNLPTAASAELIPLKPSAASKNKKKKQRIKEQKLNGKSDGDQGHCNTKAIKPDCDHKVDTDSGGNGASKNSTETNTGDVIISTSLNEASLKQATVAANALDRLNLASFDKLPMNTLPKELLFILRCQHIKPLKKRIRKSRAKFICHLCDYSCNNLHVCKLHIQSNKHHASLLVEQHDQILRQLPDPCDNQLDCIDKLLESVYASQALKDTSILKRLEIVDKLSELCQDPELKNCELKLYGSSASQLGLTGCDANINLSLSASAGFQPGSVLKKMFTCLSEHPELTDVTSDYEAKHPTIYFKHTASGTRCVLGINNTAAVQTSELLGDYASLDRRVKVLCVGLRCWAKICKIDKPSEGTLPPYAFDILVVYFLQRLSPPVLPILYDSENSKLNRKTVMSNWVTKNRMSAANLWVELFRYFALTFPTCGDVATIRILSGISVSQKNWRNKSIAIEDPFMSARNLARSISSPNVNEFIVNCFKKTFGYFAIPRTKAGPSFNPKTIPMNRSTDGTFDFKNVDVLRSLNFIGILDSDKPKNESTTVQLTADVNRECTENVGDDCSIAESGEDESSDSDSDMNDLNPTRKLDENVNEKSANLDAHKTLRDSENRLQIDIHNRLKQNRLATPEHILEFYKSVKKDDYVYHFLWKDFTGGKNPVIECSVCHKEGHVKKDCPEEKLPPLCSLPPMTKGFLEGISLVCQEIYKSCLPPKEETKARENLIIELQTYIQSFYADAELHLFGSSRNGFGFKRSDLDICLTFKGNGTGEGINYCDVITNLAEKLKQHKSFTMVVAIPTAKVPIVKFTHLKAQRECDISLYNTLGTRNTQMLLMYSQIDPRVAVLGYTMKYFAKLCDIGDASRGSLSSYAYTLMVLYFLQQRNPPVIPVLQELRDKDSQPGKHIVDGWNVWYYSDLKNLETVWPHVGENIETIGELWLGLMKFYTEEFNYKEHVISIRQNKILTRFEKLWNSRSIAIEDPFDLNHNLGSGVSNKMSVYIRKTFIRGREVFGKPLNALPNNFRSLRDYLFDSRQFVEGPPPNDRGCRICGKIGHKVKECPKKKSRQQRKNRNGDDHKDQLTTEGVFKNHNLATNRDMPNLNQPQPMGNHFPTVRPIESVRLFPHFSGMIARRTAPVAWNTVPRPFAQPNLNQRVPIPYVAANSMVNRLPSPFPSPRLPVVPPSNIRMNMPINVQQGNAFLDHRQPPRNSFRQ